MNLTDLANARSGFSQEMNNLLTLIAGSHTAEQRTAQITTTTAECFTLCKTAKAVRVANPNSILTEEFYARPDLPLCELMDSYHINLGGKHMYEMFCNKVVAPRDDCQYPVGMHTQGSVTNTPQGPYPTPADLNLPTGPLVLLYPAGSDIVVNLFGFVGTIEFYNGTTINYPTPSDITHLDLPDTGNGFCVMLLRGDLCYWFNDSETTADRLGILQFGTECAVRNLRGPAFLSVHPFEITALDTPPFGEHGWGTDIPGLFARCVVNPSRINICHWDWSSVTNTDSMFYQMYTTGGALDASCVSLPGAWKTTTMFNSDPTYVIEPTWY